MTCCFPRLFPTYDTNSNRLYETCQWEDKAIRKLIAEGRISPRLKGAEYRTNDSEQECPICFLYYGDVNVTKCCSACICTECFLQVRPQKEKQSACPFCNCSKLQVSVAKKPTQDDIQARNKEEQMVIEARIRGANKDAGLHSESQLSGFSDHETTPAVTKKTSPAAVAPQPPSTSGFGSQLEKDERFLLLKKRSESFASNEGNRTPQSDKDIIKAIAMTPEERSRLEAEMRAQHSHPLTLQVEAEAQQRIFQNEQTYNRNNPGNSSYALRAQRPADMFRSGGGGRLRQRDGAPRDWNSIVDAFERGGNGEVASLDDLVVLEAAILLSMEEEARRSRDGDGFDAERHARDGFPLVRSFLSGQAGASLGRAESIDRGTSSTPSSSSAATQDLARSLSSSQRRNQNSRSAAFSGAARYFRGMGDAALDTASMMMRGISEEEQIAMAIAASLQEQSNTESTQTVEGNDGNETSDVSENDSRLRDSGESHGLQIESVDRAASEVVVDPSLSLGEADHRCGEVSNPSSLQGDQETIDSAVEATTITELARVVTDSVVDESSNDCTETDTSSQVGSSPVPIASLESSRSSRNTDI